MRKDKIFENNGIEIRATNHLRNDERIFIDNRKNGVLISKEKPDKLFDRHPPRGVEGIRYSQTLWYFISGFKYKELYRRGRNEKVVFYKMSGKGVCKYAGEAAFYKKNLVNMTIADFTPGWDEGINAARYDCRLTLDRTDKKYLINYEYWNGEEYGYEGSILFDMRKKEDRDIYEDFKEIIRNMPIIDIASGLLEDFCLAGADEEYNAKDLKPRITKLREVEKAFHTYARIDWELAKHIKDDKVCR
jgi:hypothetical protein